MDEKNPVDIMARTLWGEARGEKREGIIAVANVIMNRVKKPRWWGRSVITVCLKPYQFSCWLQNDPNYKKMIILTDKDPIFRECLDIATQAVSGELPDKTNGATSYYAISIKPPAWTDSMDITAKIGHHIFYKERGNVA